MRICAYTPVDYRADFIDLQRRTLAAFCREQIELVVLNNAPDSRLGVQEAIDTECRRLALRHYHVPNPDTRTANYAHARALDWGYQAITRTDGIDIALMLDFDCLPVKSTSLVDLMGGALVMGWAQSRGHVNYYWPGFLALRVRDMPSPYEARLACGKIEEQNCDVGGELYWWLRANPGVVTRDVKCSGQLRRGDGTFEILPLELRDRYEDLFNYSVIEGGWLHYGAGSNWNNLPSDLIARKRAHFGELVEGCLAGKWTLGDI